MFFGITDIWAYVAGAFFIVLLPGPNSIFVLTHAAQHGVRAGYRGVAGIFLGDTVLMVLAAAGAASLLKSNPLLFTLVKYVGGAYLVWMGVQMLRGAWTSWRSGGAPAVIADDEVTVAAPRTSAFRRALTISLLNPKAILFLVSFFIQFVDPDYGTPVLSFLILGTIIQVFSLVYLSVLIFSGTFLAHQFRARRKLSAGLTSGIGILFLGFGLKLATTSLG